MPTNIAQRASVLTLLWQGKSTAEISGMLGIPKSTIRDIHARAIQRGFEASSYPLIINDEYIVDAPRSGRPKKQIPETQDKILAKVRFDRYGREKICADIAGELSLEHIDISATTVWRILRSAGLRKTKPTRKPGLTKKMMSERLAFCLEHRGQDFRNVIFTDETSVVLLHRRGGYRIWRSPDERFLRSYIRERWKGSMEFMFWGSFCYDRKGPYHCWLLETATEKRASEVLIEEWNKDLEPILRENWELENGLRRINLRQNPPGKKPTWKFTKKNGKLTREGSKGGIDWYRYHTTILIPKLLPFAQECMIQQPDMLVQEDKAPAHNHQYQQKVFDIAGVNRLLWPGNSPDLNAIEPCWPWMKRYTTKKGAPKSRTEAVKVWGQAQNDLPQERIQQWIDRIPRHIEEIIRLEGGNEYEEGRGHVRR